MDFRLATLAAHKEYTQRIRMHNSSSPRPPPHMEAQGSCSILNRMRNFEQSLVEWLATLLSYIQMSPKSQRA